VTTLADLVLVNRAKGYLGTRFVDGPKFPLRLATEQTSSPPVALRGRTTAETGCRPELVGSTRGVQSPTLAFVLPTHITHPRTVEIAHQFPV